MSLIPSNSPDFNSPLATAINQGSTTEVDLVSGAIAINRGSVIITKATAAAMTLPLPTPGTDDGKVLRVISTTAAAHTITTPANGLNLTLHIATFAANVGSAVELVAYNGSWYMASNVGTTLS